MLSGLRGVLGRVLTPAALALLRLGVSPSAVTVAGTLATVAAALLLLPRGSLVVGPLVIALCLLGDGLDGTMARRGGRVTRFGAFLDSTLDRLADAAVFVGLAAWASARDDSATLWLALGCLVFGFLVSYARARAEAEGWEASVGWFERSERLSIALLGTLAVGLGAPVVVLQVALGLVAAGSAVTALQRIAAALRAARGEQPRPEPEQP